VTTIHVDIWSDVACPWCYIGKRRFDGRVRGRWVANQAFHPAPRGMRHRPLGAPSGLQMRR
jgi:predicted DsbA family dithiol-disulfide isomerase